MIEKSIEEIQAEFRELMADVLKGRKSALYADDWLTQTLQAERTKRDEVVAEAMKKRDDLYKEINVKKLLEQMEEDLLEYGQYHDPECLQMSEWADPDSECHCETIKAMRSFATEWVGKTNELWVQNLMHHRQ